MIIVRPGTRHASCFNLHVAVALAEMEGVDVGSRICCTRSASGSCGSLIDQSSLTQLRHAAAVYTVELTFVRVASTPHAHPWRARAGARVVGARCISWRGASCKSLLELPRAKSAPASPTHCYMRMHTQKCASEPRGYFSRVRYM